jgi:hypothetical protein
MSENAENTDNTSDDGQLLTDVKEPESSDSQSGDEGTAAGNDGGTADTDKGEGDATAGEGDAEQSLDAYADLKAPEGMDIDADTLGKATPLFEKYGLSKEAAQEFVDFYASEIQASSQRQAESFDQLKQDWLAQTKGDNEIGGDKLDEHVKVARIALDKFGTPELTTLLNEFGLGNHPEIIRAWAKVGRLTQEDNPGNS